MTVAAPRQPAARDVFTQKERLALNVHCTVQICYSDWMMVLSKDHPPVIRYRLAEPALTPALQQERYGAIPNVVFPTGIDRPVDLGLPHRLDVHWRMADRRIGVTRLDLPEVVPVAGAAGPPDGKV